MFLRLSQDGESVCSLLGALAPLCASWRLFRCSGARARWTRSVVFPSLVPATLWWPMCYSRAHVLSDSHLTHPIAPLAQVKTAFIHFIIFHQVGIGGPCCTRSFGDAMSGSQSDKRLNHREAERHLPQQFGGSRLDYGDFAFRMEGYAAVLSRDGQGGAQF